MIGITPVDITPGSASAWTDVDFTAHIAAGSTGVVLHFVNTDGMSWNVGWRQNGSTDARTQALAGNAHFWCSVGIDGSDIAEIYVGTTTGIDVYVEGYWDSRATFFTNAVDKSLTGFGTWTDINISGDTGGATAIGAIFEVILTSGLYLSGLRSNGSTDNRYVNSAPHWGAIIGVDGSEICEGRAEAGNVDFFLTGYITTNATFNTNATDVSLAGTGAWTDLSALPATSIAGFIEVVFGTTNTNYGLRKNGSAQDIYKHASKNHAWGMIEADGSQLIEGEIGATDCDFFLVGYATAAGGGSVTYPQLERGIRGLLRGIYGG